MVCTADFRQLTYHGVSHSILCNLTLRGIKASSTERRSGSLVLVRRRPASVHRTSFIASPSTNDARDRYDMVPAVHLLCPSYRQTRLYHPLCQISRPINQYQHAAASSILGIAMWSFHCGLGAEQESNFLEEYNTMITTCEDLLPEIGGVVLVVAPVICEKKKLNITFLSSQMMGAASMTVPVISAGRSSQLLIIVLYFEGGHSLVPRRVPE